MNTTPERIAIGMSGGLDSSVAAAMLVEQGYEVIGLTAHMWKEGSRCCSIEDVERARKVCWHLDIKHYVLNGSEPFEQNVVTPFVKAYTQGKTPSPCIVCNEKIKFGYLLNRAIQFDCQGLATGHYARIIQEDGLYQLHRAKDLTKDQSYFLHRLSQQKLAHIFFPLGHLIKQKDVAPYAETHKLPITSRGESQDLCFVPPNEYGNFVESHCDNIIKVGPIVDNTGQQLGTHRGIHRYTVGQRRGLNISSPIPMYVIRIDAPDNTVVVGPREQAMSQTCVLQDVHWISGQPPQEDGEYDLRIRYRHNPAPARIHLAEDGSVHAQYLSPQFAITPGQSGVIYHGDRVMGGGWIA